MSERIKSFLSDEIYFYTILILLVGVLSFGLGRWSVVTDVSDIKPQVVLTAQPAALVVSDSDNASTQPQTAENSQLVASKKGTKYHLRTCPGAKQMSDQNKIYFANEAQAKAAGYTRAKNCIFKN